MWIVEGLYELHSDIPTSQRWAANPSLYPFPTLRVFQTISDALGAIRADVQAVSRHVARTSEQPGFPGITCTFSYTIHWEEDTP